MEKQSVDRRVQRTRQMLHDALFALIEERGYDTLSIQDISERANIGRATFYVHYRDKEQLLRSSIKEEIEGLKARLHVHAAHDILVKRQTFSVALFQHVYEHASLYRALLSERGAALVIVRLHTEMAEHVRHFVIDQFVAVASTPLPADMLTEYCASALWSLVGWWLRNDFPKSVEEMGQIFWQLINQGLVKALGLPENGEQALLTDQNASARN